MRIKESLLENNSWWQNRHMDFKFLLDKVRKEFRNIQKNLDEKRILSIIGPRRVGKSTLIYQTIHYLLEEKQIEPKRILMFSGDDPSLFFHENDRLSDVLNVYFDEILEENIAKLSSKVYIFIDEIHFIKNWQNFLKTYFDRKYNIKFIVTGSSSLHLFKDSNESLLGRIENIYILPLNFHQFLNFHRTYVSQIHDLTIPKFDFDDPETSFRNLEIFYYSKDLKLEILKVLKEYMLVGRLS